MTTTSDTWYTASNLEPVYEYCESQSSVPSPLCEEIADYTRKNVDMSVMLSGPIVVSFLGFLIRSIGATRVLEIGTYTGYSALGMAESLPIKSQLVTLDINEKTLEIAKGFWSRSPRGSNIQAICGPALESLKQLKGPFDFVFIDADKPGYVDYFKKSLELLSPHGIIVADNCLYGGKAIDPETSDPSAQGIRRFNDFIRSSPNLKSCLLPVRDGLNVIHRAKA